MEPQHIAHQNVEGQCDGTGLHKNCDCLIEPNADGKWDCWSCVAAIMLTPEYVFPKED